MFYCIIFMNSSIFYLCRKLVVRLSIGSKQSASFIATLHIIHDTLQFRHSSFKSLADVTVCQIIAIIVCEIKFFLFFLFFLFNYLQTLTLLTILILHLHTFAITLHCSYSLYLYKQTGRTLTLLTILTLYLHLHCTTIFLILFNKFYYSLKKN